MQVFLVRHAEAIDETVAVRDPARYLTPNGRAQAKALGERLRWHDAGPTHLWSSPLVRCVQTAELILGVIDCGVPLESQPLLVPDANPRDVVAAFRSLPDDAEVMLVGHEPGLSAIGALLCGRSISPLVKAEAVRIDGKQIRWRFAWDAEAPRTRPTPVPQQ